MVCTLRETQRQRKTTERERIRKTKREVDTDREAGAREGTHLSATTALLLLRVEQELMHIALLYGLPN